MSKVMLGTTTIEKLNNTSVEERISIIEMLLVTLKNDIKKDSPHQMKSAITFQRPAFGFMKDTGKVLGNIVSPILDQNTWEVLQ